MSMAFQKAWYKKHGMEMPASAAPMSAAKVKAKQKPVAKPEPVKKPLSKDERMSVIKKAAEKNVRRGKESRLRAAFGGEQMGAQYDNPISIARAGGIIKGYRLGEATKPDASMAMTNQLKMKMISDKDKRTLGKVAVLMARERTLTAQRNKDKKNAYVRAKGLEAMKTGKVDPARGHSPTRFGREVLKKEEIEMNEVTKKEAEALLGGPVKAKPKMPPGKQPAGYRYVRGLARKAMKAGMKKEEVEQVDEGKVAKALAVGAMSLASMGAKAHTDTTKSVDQLAKERPALAQRLHDIGASGQVPASDKRAAELQRKQDQEMPASERRAKEIEKMKKEEVEQVDEAGKGYGPGWMLKHPDGKTLDAKLKAKKELERKRQKSYGDPKAGVSVKSEEVEQIDEVGDTAKGRAALSSYIKKKYDQFYHNRMMVKTQDNLDRLRKDANKNLARAEKRLDAVKTEEVEQIDELNQKTLKSYINKSIETGRANDAEGDHNLYRATSKVARNLATPTLKNRVSKLKYTPMTKHKNPYEYQVSRDELANRKVSEEVEQIDELKKSTLASYVKRATRDVASASRLQRGYETDAARNEFAPVRRGSELAAKNMRKFAGKRSRGIAKAVDKLAKEEVEQIEEGKADKSLAAKAQKSGISLGTLKSVFRRGVAAWNSGHRPGTTPSQWGHARVNSYINKGKTYHTADKDLREEKAKGKDPETSTEVELAKKHGDPKKITYGDVIKARIEASKKKALNKGE